MLLTIAHIYLNYIFWASIALSLYLTLRNKRTQAARLIFGGGGGGKEAPPPPPMYMPPPPPPVDTSKQDAADAALKRQEEAAAALRRGSVASTDITQGALSDTSKKTKPTLLGGTPNA